MRDKPNMPLLLGLMVLFTAMRWPGLWPDELKNFSPVYAIFFCAGVYFRGSCAWLVPVTLMFISDLAINHLYYGQMGYNLVGSYMAHNYALLMLLFVFGWAVRKKEKPAWLIGGGFVGSCIFYLASNTLAWLGDLAYLKTLAGLVQAFTTGVPGIYPPAWMFFSNTVISGTLFTAIIVYAIKYYGAPQATAQTEEKFTVKLDKIDRVND